MSTEDILRLQIKVDDVLVPQITELRTNQKELLRELGRIEGLAEAAKLHDDIRELRAMHNSQEGPIGGLVEAVASIKDVLANASDKGVAEAAKAIVLNVDARSATDITNTGDMSVSEGGDAKIQK